MKLNTKKVNDEKTHGGAVASIINKEQELRRSVLSCMLWEGQFYEDGISIAQRISDLIKQVKPEVVAEIAVQARNDMKLRHVPLLLARELARVSYKGTADLLNEIIQRPDELTEFLAIYWKDGKCPISAQVKKGLARAFTKFNEYSLAKYNRKEEIKLRDILFLSHAKPKDQEQEELWKKLINDELETPDTWEVELSVSTDKKSSWERLLKENKLGSLALLKNLRNMKETGVNKDLVFSALENMDTSRVLPFRFISAASFVPEWEGQVEQAMFKSLNKLEKFDGKTVLIIDVSGSMGGMLSSKSTLNRMDAAIALSLLAREICDDVKIYITAGNDWKGLHATEVVPQNRRGFALRDKIRELKIKLGGGGIFLTQVMDYVYDKEKEADRVIVFTDEQDCDKKLNPDKANAFGKRNYINNVSSFKNGISYSKFVHINGFSEAILNYIKEFEKSGNE